MGGSLLQLELGLTLPSPGACKTLAALSGPHLLLVTSHAVSLVDTLSNQLLELSNMRHSKTLQYASASHSRHGRDLKIVAAIVNQAGTLAQYETIVIHGGA